MNENMEKITGVIYKHGENDFSIWFPELTKSENEEINAFLEKFANTGCSIRGTKQDIISELEDSIN